jgi:hypothetical protein
MAAINTSWHFSLYCASVYLFSARDPAQIFHMFLCYLLLYNSLLVLGLFADHPFHKLTSESVRVPCNMHVL